MYPEFNGRTVLVTGGSRGIGAATAAAFAAEGAHVWVVGRDRQALDDTVAGIEKDGGTAFAAVADVTSLPALEAVRDQVGPVDVLAAFAGGGIARPGPTAAMTEQEWHTVVDGNLTATFLTLKTFLPAMQERRSGSIITMASTAGRQPSNLPGPWPHQWGAPVAYAAAKAGIIMLTQHVAVEVGRDNVRVNCVSPSTIRVERMAQIPLEVQEKIAATHPLARLGEPSDVATTSLFLASDGAAWLTGLTIDIAGGRITN